MGDHARPIVRWPGGKRWLAPTMAEMFSVELEGAYYEPFLGGAAVFFALEPNRAHLSDANCHLIDFYQTCIRDPEKVVDAARRFRNCEVDYYRARDAKPRTEVGKAGRFLYLNKTCWGGVFRLNRRGEFNVPYGEPGRVICRKHEVMLASSKLANARIVCCDFEDSMRSAGSGDVVFADPPYTAKGQFNGFVRYNESLFSWADQLRLARVSAQARRRGAFVAVCGSYHRDILALYENWWVMTTERVSRVAKLLSSRKSVHECVMLSRKPRLKSISVERVTQGLIQSIPHCE
ncbi:DNA adenine methylase [Roseiconus lacunae]|uniref:DNA adenine methylase n=1 Tax=Roseiconus lacunae TaxID=2605694 RepID=UPI0036F35C5A